MTKDDLKIINEFFLKIDMSEKDKISVIPAFNRVANEVIEYQEHKRQNK